MSDCPTLRRLAAIPEVIRYGVGLRREFIEPEKRTWAAERVTSPMYCFDDVPFSYWLSLAFKGATEICTSESSVFTRSTDMPNFATFYSAIFRPTVQNASAPHRPRSQPILIFTGLERSRYIQPFHTCHLSLLEQQYMIYLKTT